MTELWAVPLAIMGCALAAYAITSVIVAVADMLGLCWTMQGEEKRHAKESAATFSDPARQRNPTR